VLIDLLRGARNSAARALELLPISSRVLGPPKGFYSSFQEYVGATGDRLAKEWFVLPKETRQMNVPNTALDRWKEIFQPLVHLSPGFGLYCIENGRFHRHSGAITTKDDRLLASFSAWMGGGPRDNWLFKKVTLGSVKRVQGNILLLVLDRNYYHFLIEEIPRIRIAEWAGFPLEFFDHILMYSPMHASQRTVCDRLNIELKRIIPLESNSHVECQRLYFTTPPWRYGSAFTLMAREFLLRICNGSVIGKKRRIYVSRERCTHGKISNEDQLLPILFEAGFEKIFPETLSFDEQVALFQGAECIVGAHGAGLTNIIFSSPGSRLVEIRNSTYDQNEPYQAKSGNIFWRLSEFLGIEYHAFFAVPNGTAYRAPEAAGVESVRLPNLTVDIDSFGRLLRRVLTPDPNSTLRDP